MDLSRKEQLQKTLATAHKELAKIRDAENQERARRFVGKCFKYRNCYSCPESPKDYWWIYAKVLDDKGKSIQFQCDKNGAWSFEPDRMLPTFHEGGLSGWREIRESEYRKAAAKALAAITGILAK